MLRWAEHGWALTWASGSAHVIHDEGQGVAIRSGMHVVWGQHGQQWGCAAHMQRSRGRISGVQALLHSAAFVKLTVTYTDSCTVSAAARMVVMAPVCKEESSRVPCRA